MLISLLLPCSIRHVLQLGSTTTTCPFTAGIRAPSSLHVDTDILLRYLVIDLVAYPTRKL